MAENVTPNDTVQQSGTNVRLGLGRPGWIVWVLLVLMNFVPLMSEYTGVSLAAYGVFCVVGGYIWMRVAKFILSYIGFFN